MKNVYETVKTKYLSSFMRQPDHTWSWRWRMLDPHTGAQWLDIGVFGHNYPTRKAARNRAVEGLEQELGYGR